MARKVLNRSLRREIAALSSTNDYYETKGHAIIAADKVLSAYDWTTGDCSDLPGDDGRAIIPIVTKEFAPLQEEIGSIVFTWHRMPSGRYEITMYLA